MRHHPKVVYLVLGATHPHLVKREGARYLHSLERLAEHREQKGNVIFIPHPSEMWESVKTGNCGPPIETEAGWFVVTPGVGPMRKYCIGTTLLDLQDPTKSLAVCANPCSRRKASIAKAMSRMSSIVVARWSTGAC